MTIRSLIGDCREVLPTLADRSVHCVVTSPPYFGLRDYGTAKWEGGDAECDHAKSQLRKGFISNSQEHRDIGWIPYSDICGKCGAIRIDSQIGLEPTPQAYVDQLVAVFREVRRVLRDDGTLWLNLGDSYSTHPPTTTKAEHQQQIGATGGDEARRTALGRTRIEKLGGLPEKNLLGIPWRVAFALQADGWYLRQDIIWSKPNPMPESVTDRCTKAHEYMFLLSKNARYFYDAEAIAELTSENSHPTGKDGYCGPVENGKIVNGDRNDTGKTIGRNGNKRNKRSVWEIATQPYSEAHFATFPPALIEPCILAGCPKGGSVLDPFGGAGTTGMVADRLERNAVMVELNPAYAQMAEYRIRDDAGMFADIT